MVMAAFSGPDTQSSSLAGGNKDCSVGPGVGRGLTTVQPGGGESLEATSSEGVEVCSDDSVVCKVSVSTGVSMGVSVICTASVSASTSVVVGMFPWQLVINMARKIININIRFIIFSPDRLDFMASVVGKRNRLLPSTYYIC